MAHTNYNFNSLSHPSYFPDGEIRATFIFSQEKSTFNIQKQLLFSAKTGKLPFPYKILPVSFRQIIEKHEKYLYCFYTSINCNAINPHRQETFWSEKRVTCFRWPIQIITLIHYRTPPIFQRGKSGQLLSFRRKNQL